MTRIKFRGEEWMLVDGGKKPLNGPICTPEAYANGQASYAHLGTDGVIRRFHQVIGTLADIEVIGPMEEPEVKVSTVEMLLDPSWRPPVVLGDDN